MSTKVCSGCGKEKDKSKFNKNSSKKDGLQTTCRQCCNEYSKQHYEKNKKYYKDKNQRIRNRNYKFLRRVKSKLECIKCGEGHPACLDFHHRNKENKEYNISEMPNLILSIENIKNEIKKCIVLCSNCHRKEHYQE